MCLLGMEYLRGSTVCQGTNHGRLDDKTKMKRFSRQDNRTSKDMHGCHTARDYQDLFFGARTSAPNAGLHLWSRTRTAVTTKKSDIPKDFQHKRRRYIFPTPVPVVAPFGPPPHLFLLLGLPHQPLKTIGGRFPPPDTKHNRFIAYAKRRSGRGQGKGTHILLCGLCVCVRVCVHDCQH